MTLVSSPSPGLTSCTEPVTSATASEITVRLTSAVFMAAVTVAVLVSRLTPCA
jgi:hypothetical protein